MFPEHPPPGQPHPWTDPLAAGDPVVPRPDWALHQVGPMPQPSPADFPYTEQGRRDYYLAVENAARQSMLMQQQQMGMQQQHLAMQQRRALQAQAAERDRRRLLLLRP